MKGCLLPAGKMIYVQPFQIVSADYITGLNDRRDAGDDAGGDDQPIPVFPSEQIAGQLPPGRRQTRLLNVPGIR